MGLSEFEELQRRCVELEELYNEAVKDRDEAIEERNKATVLIALQLQDETEELNARIVDLRNQNSKFQEANEDLKIRLEYAKDDLKKLQQRHIVLQIEQEQCMKEKEEALASVHRVKTSQEKEKDTNKTADKTCEDTMLDKQEDPAYSQVKHDIFTSASEEDLELEPRPPVTLRASKPEDLFDVHEELGKGKFGVVKKVTEKSTQTVFAAKYIRLSSSGSGSSRDDIMREINIMNQLHHKRLVGLIDAFDVSKNIVMVMEFVSGGELFERVADADCLTEKEAAYYMYQLLQGLQYMHKKNIIHLDLKPENIVCVSKDSWDIKLIDFGLAQELTPGITMKALKGTPEFMAPEAVNFDTISFSTDMWSVGVIAYILLSGLSPLLGDDVNETLANVTAAEWDFEDESFDVISEEAKNFISMLLVKNPRKRNTVGESLKHDWMKRSASANAVKIDTKKLKQFLAKRRWQKSVNALVAVRRLSNITSLMGLKGRPSIAPSLATVASAEEEDEEEKETGAEKKVHLETRKEKAIGGHLSKNEHSKKEDISKIDESVEEDEKGNKKEAPMQCPVFIEELSDISANEGDTVSLEVVINNDISCEVEWFKNGGDVTEGGRLSLINHGEGRHALVIRDTEEDDSVLSKSDNTDEEEEEIDSSIEVPVFAKELSDVTASERDTVTLEVVVSGASPYELEWFKNAVDITECERISLVNHDDGRFSLVIRDCEDDDTGEYCCVAQNEAGRVTCAGWLTVEVESSKSEEEESEESEVEEIVWKEIVEIREGDVQTFYCIEEEVGRGRFGIVKKCVELDTATRFCAKFIKSRPSQKAEFKREIDVMNTLHHPRLIRLYDAFEEPRQIILIMEYARGGDLFARIDGDSLPEFEAVKILTQVLEGLKYMHDNHFMHLDLKPQNVMFKNEGGSKIKLIDFSLSRKFDSQQEVKISFGTAEYVAPEIVNYEPVTLAADMWAIGVISYIMLSGDSPFLGPSEAETFSKITEARWEFTDVFDYVSKEAKNFITRLLLKDPKQRMTVDECLAHEWIKSPGFTGKHQSKSSSEGELASDVNHNIVSPTELKRQESKKFDEQDAPLDIHQLEAKLKELLTKAQSEKKEREELEERLREEEERADALEDELRESETMVKKFEENMSKLGKENTDLMKKARTNSETLKRVAESEGEKRGLEDKLAEQTKSREALIRKYDLLKEKLESYDILEEKVYLLERDRKESRGTKEKLESKIEGYEREREFLLQKDDKNDLEMTEFENEISNLKKERTEYENKYVTLREEKESLVEELTKRFSALDEQKKILAEEKVHLERDLEAVKTENEEMKVKFQRVAEEWELSKEKANKENGEKDKDEVENLSKLKRQKDEAQKTCEDLASKLSKAYVELERARSQDNNETDAVNLQEQISTLKESLSSLKGDRDHVEEELEEREAEIEELKKKIEQLETDKTALTEERDKQSVDYKAQIDMANEKIVALQRASRGRDEDNRNSEMLQSEVSTLREKLAAAKRTNEELEAKVKSNGEEIALLLKRGQSSTNGKIATEKYTSEIEGAKEEILRLETENKNLKELSIHPSIASLQKEIGILEADNNSLRTEKEDLAMQISAKDKKIELLEKRVKELTEIRSCTVNGTENGECIEINETEAQTRKYDEELKKAKHRTAELEVELEHLNNSYNAKRKRELDEMETKWAKRLRKECMELQSELSDKHNREKQLWLKKEVELQNIIRQMKIVMDKRLGQAENERRKLEQQLMTVRSSSFHGSMISLDSNSDDSGESPSITPGATSNDVIPGDCLSDRELRRVAYKLNGEEWSQLGTFLGVGDRDLAQLSALSMGPQEKAFRLLCVWRTRCRLGRAQMISQLAVSLEEVKRKDVAQFVLEQFMSGKPRKKLFGW